MNLNVNTSFTNSQTTTTSTNSILNSEKNTASKTTIVNNSSGSQSPINVGVFAGAAAAAIKLDQNGNPQSNDNDNQFDVQNKKLPKIAVAIKSGKGKGSRAGSSSSAGSGSIDMTTSDNSNSNSISNSNDMAVVKDKGATGTATAVSKQKKHIKSNPTSRRRSGSGSNSRANSISSINSSVGDDFYTKPHGRVRSASIGGSSSSSLVAPSNDSNSNTNTNFTTSNDSKVTSSGRINYGKSRSLSLCDVGISNNHLARLCVELKSTLNESFPDYDFSSAKPESFVVDRIDNVIRIVNNYFSDLMKEEPNFLENLWTAIDSEVKLSHCEVYSYIPDMEGDPFSDEGCLWSFNYFFIDRDNKKIAYFTCVASRRNGRNGRNGLGTHNHSRNDLLLTSDQEDHCSVDDDDDTDVSSGLRSPSSIPSASQSPSGGASPREHVYHHNHNNQSGAFMSPFNNHYTSTNSNSDFERYADMDEDTAADYAKNSNAAVQVDDDSGSSCDDMS